MVWFKRLGKWAETVNTYYEFTLVALAAALFLTRRTRVVEWLFLVAVPLLTGWTGYLARAYIEQRRRREGFHLISNKMTYEIGEDNHYVLKYETKLRAISDHLMMYPIGYQWTGAGEEGVPRVEGAGQQLLAPVQYDARGGRVKAVPYESTTVSADDRWHYWFVSFNPPIGAGQTTKVRYTQTFHDKKRLAKPFLYYMVKVPMERLELRVTFAPAVRPSTVACSYIKPSLPTKAIPTTGVVYDDEDGVARWVIEQPKRGYCYLIHW